MEIWILPLITGSVIIYLWHQKRLSKTWSLALLLACLAAGAAMLLEARMPDRTPISALSEDEQSFLRQEHVLEAEFADGAVEEVQIRLPEKVKTADEIEQLFSAAMHDLDTTILGENKEFSHIEWNLQLPLTLPDYDITLNWTSSRPDVLNWQGSIGKAAEKTGTTITLSAILTYGEQTQTYRRLLTVFPSREGDMRKELLQDAVDNLNVNHAEGVYALPQTVEGQSVTWYQKTEKHAPAFCLFLLLVTFLAALAGKQKQEEKEQKRKEELLLAYPDLLSRLQLYLAAGLSLRKTWERLAADARQEKKRTGKESALGRELLRIWYELENGILETDALAHFGERCALPEYKTLALLLAQNQKQGGYRLPQVLETEVQEAFAMRMRRARIAGEKAAVQLAIPMGMMLLVVLVVIMVPAMLSF